MLFLIFYVGPVLKHEFGGDLGFKVFSGRLLGRFSHFRWEGLGTLPVRNLFFEAAQKSQG